MGKKDLVTQAVSLELGSAEDLERFTVAELEELLSDSGTKEPVARKAPAAKQKEPVADEKPKNYTTVADLQRLGRIKTAG